MTTTTAPPTAYESPSGRRGRLALAVAGGLLLGVLTNLAQGWLPGAWNQIANSGSVWSAVAFVAGAVLYGREVARGSLARAALAGAGAEVALVLGYYGYAEWGRDGAGSLFFPLVWLGMALVAGPLFGVAGVWWRSGREERRRVVGLGAFAGLWGMEGLSYAWNLHYAAQAYACLGLAVGIPLLLARGARERALTLGAAAVCSLVAYGVVVLPLNGLSA